MNKIAPVNSSILRTGTGLGVQVSRAQSTMGHGVCDGCQPTRLCDMRPELGELWRRDDDGMKASVGGRSQPITCADERLHRKKNRKWTNKE